MSDIAATSSGIAIGVMLIGCAIGWVWIGVHEFRERSRQWRERRERWMKFLK